MDRCVLLTSTPLCVVSPRGNRSGCALVISQRGETTHKGVDVNNTHLSMINPLSKVWVIFERYQSASFPISILISCRLWYRTLVQLGQFETKLSFSWDTCDRIPLISDGSLSYLRWLLFSRVMFKISGFRIHALSWCRGLKKFSYDLSKQYIEDGSYTVHVLHYASLLRFVYLYLWSDKNLFCCGMGNVRYGS